MLKYTFIGFIYILCSCEYASQEPQLSSSFDQQTIRAIKQDTSMDKHYYYPFNGTYINLETLTIDPIAGEVLDWKLDSKYKHRFDENIGQEVWIDNRKFNIEKNRKKGVYNLLIWEEETAIKSIALPTEKPLPTIDYTIRIYGFGETVVAVILDLYSKDYTVVKYDRDGKELMQKQIERVDHDGDNYIPNGGEEDETTKHYIGKSGHEIVFSASAFLYPNSIIWDKHYALVLDVNDFSTQTYNMPYSAVVLDENEANIAGFLTMGEGYGEARTTHRLTMKDGRDYGFSIPYAAAGYDLLLSGDLLYIANYSPIATGSSLHCFDLKTGKMAWQADVLQYPIPHSQYLNKVTLSLYENTLIMEGNEIGIDYVQFFDATTGERLADF